MIDIIGLLHRDYQYNSPSRICHSVVGSIDYSVFRCFLHLVLSYAGCRT